MATGGGLWLVKSDPSVYGFPELCRDKATLWEGVRNPTAQLHLRAMAKGDGVLIYHTGAQKAIVGRATVIEGPVPDPTADDPRIVAVRLAAGKALQQPVTLAQIRAQGTLEELPLIRMGRLSVMPIPPAAWQTLLALGQGRRA